MRQQLLIYVNNYNDFINEPIFQELYNYYDTDILSKDNFLNKTYDVKIVVDFESYINKNDILSDVYIWNIKNKIIDIPLDKIKGIICSHYIDIYFRKCIMYNGIEDLLKNFGFFEKIIKVKLLCGYNQNLVNDFNKLCKVDSIWNNVQITCDNNADYYCIINYPKEGDYYDAKKTILIKMEESFGPKTFYPKEWIKPEHHQFMYFFDNRYGIKWHLNKTWKQFMTENIIKTKILSNDYILGDQSKNNFIKFVESKIKLDTFEKSNKDENILPYKYTIACENYSVNGHFTEKIIDAILGECLCFYWGCPNLEDYIDKNTFIRIDPSNHEESWETILNAINNSEWEKRIGMIKKEKFKILNNLQLMPTIEKIILDSKEEPNYYTNTLNEFYEKKEKFLYFHGDKYLIKVINELCGNIRYFVETGTFRAASSRYVAINFDIPVYTCEINHISYLKSLKNTEDVKNINIYLEKSTIMLNKLTKEINPNKTILFWLDAHTNWETYFKDELEIILNNFKNYYILIDDFKNEYHQEFSYNRTPYEYSIDKIISIIPNNVSIFFPNYNEKTSTYHPLVGWVLITNQSIECQSLNLIKYK